MVTGTSYEAFEARRDVFVGSLNIGAGQNDQASGVVDQHSTSLEHTFQLDPTLRRHSVARAIRMCEHGPDTVEIYEPRVSIGILIERHLKNGSEVAS